MRAIRPSRPDYPDGAVCLAPSRRKKRGANSSCQLGLAGSRLPDVPGQENRGAGACQASEPTGSEAQNPGSDLRGTAELVERDAEQQRSEEAGAKADAGIQPDRCSQVTRSGYGV